MPLLALKSAETQSDRQENIEMHPHDIYRTQRES